MPAFDAFFLAKPGGRSDALDCQSQSFSDPATPGEDFDSVMQATLAPTASTRATSASTIALAPGKVMSRTDKNPALAPTGRSWPAPVAAPAVSTSGKALTENVPTAKANSPSPASPATDVLSPQSTATAPEPMPLYISLPFLGSALVPAANTSPATGNANIASASSLTNQNPTNIPASQESSGWTATTFPLASRATPTAAELTAQNLAGVDSAKTTNAPAANPSSNQPLQKPTAVPSATTTAASVFLSLPDQLEAMLSPRAPIAAADGEKNDPNPEPLSTAAPELSTTVAPSATAEPEPQTTTALPATVIFNESDLSFFPLATANAGTPVKSITTVEPAVSTTPAPAVDVAIKSDAKSNATPVVESPANSAAPEAANAADKISPSLTADKAEMPRYEERAYTLAEISPSVHLVKSTSETAVEPVSNTTAQATASISAPNISAPVPAVTAPDPNLQSSLLTAAENNGTGVATMALSMKNSENTIKVAGPDAKVLPVGENGDAKEKNLPTQIIVAPVRGTENQGADLNFTFSGNSNHAIPVPETPALNAADLPSLTDARFRALDRTHDMMALHTMRLVESKSDTLSVIIKPGVGTELSLELRQHADGVEAQATLIRGDHQFLSQNWRDLQQRLEQRGIKLAPLGGEADFAAPGNSQFQQEQEQPSQEEAAQQASAFAEFAAAGPVGGATARMATVHDGWESWA
jgi:hypothetical protein